MVRRSLRAFLACGAVVLLAALGAACGSSDDEEPQSGSGAEGAQEAGGGEAVDVNGISVSRDRAAADQLPEEYRDGLKFVTSAPYAPFETFGPNEELQGLDIDVGDAIAATLGVDANWTSVPLEGVIPGVQSHKFDIALADIGATEPRLEVLDFVTYFEQGNVLVVPKGNPKAIEGLQSMCGKRLLAEQGISLENFMPATQELCAEHGKPKVTEIQLKDQASVLLGIRSNNGDAGVLSYPAAKALEATEGGAEYTIVVPEGMPAGFVPRYVGAGIAKDTTELRDAVTTALEKLLDDGVIQQLFDKYDLGDAVSPEIKVSEAKESLPFPEGTTP